MTFRIHPTADVASSASIGDQTFIWNYAQVREHCTIGAGCILGRGVYIDVNVRIGNNCKIQNNVSIFHGVTIEDGVFVGPHTCFTNDMKPRAINPDGTLKSAQDWIVTSTSVKRGASIGANATIVCGVTIGEWALIGAGSVVTRDVPDYGLVVGNPARLIGYVCPCGERVNADGKCTRCGFSLP